jgi:hypothetical protein
MSMFPWRWTRPQPRTTRSSWRKSLLEILTGLSICSCLAASAAFILSYTYEIGYHRGSQGTRVDVNMAWGVITIDRFSEYRYETPPRIWYDDLTPPEVIARQRIGGWWRGEARWERIGRRIQHRFRIGDFDVAKGMFIPPWIWQHRDMPFVLVQFPIWSWMLGSLVLPGWQFYRWLAKRMDEKDVTPESTDRSAQATNYTGYTLAS